MKSKWYFDECGIYRCRYCNAEFEPGHSVVCEKQKNLTESCRLGEFPNFDVDRSSTLFHGLNMLERCGG